MASGSSDVDPTWKFGINGFLDNVVIGKADLKGKKCPCGVYLIVQCCGNTVVLASSCEENITMSPVLVMCDYKNILKICPRWR